MGRSKSQKRKRTSEIRNEKVFYRSFQLLEATSVLLFIN